MSRSTIRLMSCRADRKHAIMLLSSPKVQYTQSLPRHHLTTVMERTSSTALQRVKKSLPYLAYKLHSSKYQTRAKTSVDDITRFPVNTMSTAWKKKTAVALH
jgi:hypothetical protein